MLIYSLLAVLPLVVPAFGGPLDARNPQCNTDDINCCNSVHQPGDPKIQYLLGLLDLPVDDTVAAPIGMNCSPIPVGGVGSSADCQQKPVCCTGDSHYGGLVNMDCNPIDIDTRL